MTNCQDEICELYLKWIEIYGKKPRCSIAKNGVDLKLKEMTDEEKNEVMLAKQIRSTNEYKAYIQTCNLEIKDLPDEFKTYIDFIEKLRKYDEEENRKMQEKKKEKEQWVYENLIQWLRTHDRKMPSTYFFKDGQWLHWNDQLTEDNLFEKKLYNSWVRSDLRKLMIKYDGVKIDDIPEEYRDKISMLREYGVKVNQNKSKKASKVNEEER